MTPPRFSVVIPAYNSAAYIADALRSLAEQTHTDFDVVVVDDGSTDGTPELARTRLDELGLRGQVRARPAALPKGPSSCRNLGLRHAAGEWIAFLDSDDRFAPAKLALVSAAIDRFGEAVRAIYHKSRKFEDGTGRALEEVGGVGAPNTPRWILDELLVGNFHATCGIVIERALLLELGGFDQSMHGVEDWWLVLRVAKRTRWVFLDQTLAEIRVRPRSLMTNQPFAHYVRQHVALLRAARRSGDLTAAQLRTLEGYTLGALTTYFAGQSFARGGWRAIAPGLLLLARLGHPGRAAALALRHLRYEALLLASRTYRRLRPRPHATR